MTPDNIHANVAAELVRANERCTSSSTTSPRNCSSASMGSWRRLRSVGFSRSNDVTDDGHTRRTSPASVVFPTCLAPRIATTGVWRSCRTTSDTCPVRPILIPCVINT